jgi:hypothetical protein
MFRPSRVKAGIGAGRLGDSVADGSRPPAAADGLLAGLEAVNAYRSGLDEAVPVVGTPEADAAFMGILGLAGLALDEVARLGGDPAALLRRVYERATVAV